MGMASAGWTQSLSPQLIGAAGENSGSSAVNLEWTLGESSVATIAFDDGMHTQGFHQPVLRVTAVQDIDAQHIYDVRVSPNPVQSLLNVSVHSDESSPLLLNLTDIHGKAISMTAMNSKDDSQVIDMSMFAAGIYLLHVKNSS